MNNLYAFSWAFMLVKNYPKEIFQPRIIKWLSAKNNSKISSLDLFDPPHDAENTIITTNKFGALESNQLEEIPKEGEKREVDE
ncbi:hypothetical protein H5410_047243, partial [Solanum commersonii]